ncbi:hypothetical protein K2173_015395 [Erythroxylum novogranatense]|uniref:Erythromycin biosynthesis protein CIII-like C-terminal domain-containing protein n=1 Tax=Erythroxylum novogranatense TaxID=1862640 RepID=A0AAV8SS50_9ROSI|nr:hypothetical protein K2173_015395 [Erythroxylum novogranatense]
MEAKSERREWEREASKALAIFMAFGTKGDVYPIAAIAAAFACDQTQYHVVLVTHSAHQDLSCNIKERHVVFLPIKSPPVLAMNGSQVCSGSGLDFSIQKKVTIEKHRQECYAVVEEVFGHGPRMEGDFILINYFALEGWSLAEHFCVRCVVAAPYVVPYSAPSSFERQFRKEFPLLYKYLQEAPADKACWKDVIHWMWPLFTEKWGSWRNDVLNLSPCPFTDPVTGVPTLHNWPSSPLLLYGFSKEVVECPDYWPSNVHVCGFWFLPLEWQFSCRGCGETSAHFPCQRTWTNEEFCSTHMKLQYFLNTSAPVRPIFIGLSSVGSMGYLRNPEAFLLVIRTVLEITDYRFILLTSGYEPLDEAVRFTAAETCYEPYSKDGTSIFDDRLFCFSGMIPYKWLFPKCAAAIHHGGSGSTAAALYAGVPQVLCPFIMDQFYWAEKMHWLGVAPEPLKRIHLVPDQCSEMSARVAANMLSKAINNALSPEVKSRALEISERIRLEDGVTEAVRILKQEMVYPN